jgi:integrase
MSDETKTRKRQLRRRGRGEGNIRLRADGRWEARITLPTGKRKSLMGHTRADVAEKLADAMAAQGRGLLVSKSMTVKAWGDQWLKQHVADLRPATVRSYTQVWNDHVTPFLGAQRLDRLTPAQVHGWQVELRKAGTGARTCALAHSVLRACLGRALRLDLLARNVCTQVTPAPVSRKTVAAFSLEEARAFLKACEGHRYAALYTVALAIGLRLGEALGLQWRDVDLDAGAIVVRQQLQRVATPGAEGKSALTLVPVKTRTGERRVTLPAFAVDALRAHRQAQNTARLKAETWHDRGFVFTRPNGLPLDPTGVTHDFRKLLTAAKLPALTFHGLRHSAASLLIASGLDARTVAETLGHSDVRLTLSVYAHVFEGSRREAARRMNRLLG